MSKISENKPALNNAVRKVAKTKPQDELRAKLFKLKKKNVLAETVQVLGRPNKPKVRDPNSDLPLPIAAVRHAMNAHGEPSEKLVVVTTTDDVHLGYFVLNETALISGQNSELVKMVIKCKLLAYKTPKGIRELAGILLQAADKLIYIAEHDGYHMVQVSGHHYEFFVWRTKVYPLGRPCPVRIVPLIETAPMPPASGSLDDWNENVGKHIVVNPYMLVTLCAAVSALLVQPFRLPRLILMLVGGSSLGKSTTQQAIRSLYERSDTDIDNFSGTAKGIQASLRQDCDKPKMMEELRQAEDKEAIIQLIFDLSSGASRKTSNANQQLVCSASLTCGLIISNENTFHETAGGATITVGLAARFIELHANGPHGMFHQIPEGMTAGEFSDMLKTTSAQFYGAFWNAWVPAVSRNIEKLRTWVPENLPKLQAELCADMNINDPVTKRMVNGMAGWACAGIIALKLKLLPAITTRATIVNALRLQLREHLARQKHNTTPVGEKIISAVRDVLDRHAGRFPNFLTINSTDQMGIYGYRRTTQRETLYLFLPTVFEEILGKQFGTEPALRELKAAGYLSTDSEGHQRQIRLSKNGRRKRFYAIKDAIRFDAE
ncbi:MAG: hypothetical protein JWR68_1755 [Polaromonas sp.]|nr:hypothetical protein [Polaromonas sp.]